MELTRYRAVETLCATVWGGFWGLYKPQAAPMIPQRSVSAHWLVFVQSAALLFPQGAQMLALLSPPSPSFRPDNICTAVLSAATRRQERNNNRLLNCWQPGAGRHRWQGGVSGDWRRVGCVAGRERASHLASVLARCPGASSAFTRQKACQELEVTLCKTLFSLGSFSGVEKGGNVCVCVVCVSGGNHTLQSANFNRQWKEKKGYWLINNPKPAAHLTF